MTELRIELSRDCAAFEPGEELSGSVTWSGESTIRSLELRLFWFTRGKGIEDAGVVEKLAFEQPLPTETRAFRFKVPQAPYSCTGTLVSITWALELITYPSKAVTRREIEIGPGKRSVSLESLPAIKTGGLSVRVGR